jgi:V8-like Glu-specific endopeptidase
VPVQVKAGENQLELSSDNAKILASDKPSRVTDELSTQYKRLQNAVVTVWSEFGHGTGFIVDQTGLILTNQHVLGPSEYISVQFDSATKIRAVKLLADPEKDVAVIWADVSAFPNAISAPLASASAGDPTVLEGERVFTIGSPLTQQKIVTTGIVSKVEAKAIISDVRIDHGNSGGPLFNSLGQVVGITTFVDQGPKGGGIAGIVRIEEAAKLLEDARAKIPMLSKPAPTLLPVEPSTLFPIDAIKETLLREKFDVKHYAFDVGDFQVAIITPPLRYRIERGAEMKAAKEKEKRTKKNEDAIQGTFRPLDELKNWQEYIGEYKAVVIIRAMPKIHETAGSAWRRSLIAGLSQGGYGGAATIRYKTDFYKMRLMCGDKEVVPIQPGKVANVLAVHNYFVNATDATYEGLYVYPPDAIAPSCGRVTLELYSEKKPDKPTTEALEEKTVTKVWNDFEPYREALSQRAPESEVTIAPAATRPEATMTTSASEAREPEATAKTSAAPAARAPEATTTTPASEAREHEAAAKTSAAPGARAPEPTNTAPPQAAKSTQVKQKPNPNPNPKCPKGTYWGDSPSGDPVCVGVHEQ